MKNDAWIIYRSVQNINFTSDGNIKPIIMPMHHNLCYARNLQ